VSKNKPASISVVAVVKKNRNTETPNLLKLGSPTIKRGIDWDHARWQAQESLFTIRVMGRDRGVVGSFVGLFWIEGKSLLAGLVITGGGACA